MGDQVFPKFPKQLTMTPSHFMLGLLALCLYRAEALTAKVNQDGLYHLEIVNTNGVIVKISEGSLPTGTEVTLVRSLDHGDVNAPVAVIASSKKFISQGVLGIYTIPISNIVKPAE